MGPDEISGLAEGGDGSQTHIGVLFQWAMSLGE